MSNKFKIFKDIGFYSASATVSQALGLIAGFWVARLLRPSDFGIWNAISLVLVYGSYCEFGVLSAMGRDLPFYLGQGDHEKAASVDGAARQATIFGAFLAALLVFAFSLFQNHSTIMAWGLRAMAVVLILQQVYTYHRTVLRSHNHFKELSQQQILSATINAGLAVVFVIFMGLIGRMIAAILALTAIVIYALYKNSWQSVPKFNLSTTWPLIRVGLPITITGFILSSLATIDRLMVITFLGEKQLGYFGLALLLTSVVSLIPAMASQVLYPRITHQFGSTGKNVMELRAFVLTPPVILSTLLPVLIGSLYISMPLVISVLLPAYKPGIAAARICLVGIFFFSILGLTDYFLVTIGKLKQYALFGCVALLLDIILDYLFIKLGYGIEGIAFGGTLITYFFYSCIVIGYALSHYTRRPGEWFKYFFKLWAPFLYMIGLLFIVGKVSNYRISTISTIELFITTSALVLLYLLGCLPLIYFAFREIKLVFIKKIVLQ